jgi:hypothetical protein
MYIYDNKIRWIIWICSNISWKLQSIKLWNEAILIRFNLIKSFEFEEFENSIGTLHLTPCNAVAVAALRDCNYFWQCPPYHPRISNNTVNQQQQTPRRRSLTWLEFGKFTTDPRTDSNSTERAVPHFATGGWWDFQQYRNRRPRR